MHDIAACSGLVQSVASLSEPKKGGAWRELLEDLEMRDISETRNQENMNRLSRLGDDDIAVVDADAAVYGCFLRYPVVLAILSVLCSFIVGALITDKVMRSQATQAANQYTQDKIQFAVEIGRLVESLQRERGWSGMVYTVLYRN